MILKSKELLGCYKRGNAGASREQHAAAVRARVRCVARDGRTKGKRREGGGAVKKKREDRQFDGL